MNMEQLWALVTMLLAISIATERAIAILKSAVKRLADPKPDPAKPDEPAPGDRWRRLAVQLIAVAIAWVLAALVATKAPGVKFPSNIFGDMAFGPLTGQLKLPIWLVGLLASGGSAFWNSIVEMLRAVKEAKRAERRLADKQRRMLPETTPPALLDEMDAQLQHMRDHVRDMAADLERTRRELADVKAGATD